MSTLENSQALKQGQYANASRFNARIQLHARCASNQYPWPLWVFDQLEKRPGMKILELGCGTGLLWQVNGTRIPADWQITVSDFSEGMLAEARKNLQAVRAALDFAVLDAQSIPYPDQSFDAVIANHLLYHLPDLNRALAEMARVLKSGGSFYASTIGMRNMLEMKELVREFTGNDNYQAVLGMVESNFSLDNGAAHLGPHFPAVRIARYENSLVINDPELLTEYILSCNDLRPGVVVLEPARAEAFKQYAAGLIQARGPLRITTESGMFICGK